MKSLKEFTQPSKIHEQIFVGYLWNNPNLYSKYKNHNIERSTFTEVIWYFYFRIGKEMYENGIRKFDDVTTYSFIASRPKTNKKSYNDFYVEYGEFETIKELMDECTKEKDNDEYHFSEIQKYETLRNFQKEGLININDKKLIQKLCDMNLQQMKSFFEYKQKEAFSNINAGEIVEYNLIDDLDETIRLLNEGDAMGLPFHDAHRLNRKIKGWKTGDLMYLVLSSGMGKTSFGVEKAILSLIEKNEKGIMYGNEEGIQKFRALLLATVASKILNTPINREKMIEGKFDEKTLLKLNNAKDWLYEHRRDMIKFFEMKKYRIEDVVNKIELLRPKGYKYVFLDTFKPDLTGSEMARWQQYSESAQNLHNCIKSDANNCGMLATVQLKIGKEFRYLDLSAIGKSLEIVEVASVVLMGRLLYSDEYEGGSNELKPYNWVKNEQFGKYVKEDYKLKDDKQYMILFIAKNRHGGVDEQIIYEVNYGINSWKEVAYVQVPRTSNVY